jgi:hypothetical protein
MIVDGDTMGGKTYQRMSVAYFKNIAILFKNDLIVVLLFFSLKIH